MEYESSYDAGTKPFNHDSNRGKWESSGDFLYACIAHAFRPDMIAFLPLIVFENVGMYALIPYFVTLALCVVPIIFIQSFLGQFSSTGYISVFRMAPIFKGIGYVSLALNFVNLTYFGVFTAIPLFYFFHSLRPTMPWSCEGSKHWMKQNYSICSNYTSKYGTLDIPSVEFLRRQFNYHEISYVKNQGTYVSVELMICSVIVWSIVAFVLLKSTELIGRFVRYSCLAVIIIMTLCLLRFCFLPGAVVGFWNFFKPSVNDWDLHLIVFTPLMAYSTLGPGWGSILAMASYNNFKTNIYRYSWIMSLVALGIMIEMSFISIFLDNFMKNMGFHSGKANYRFIEFMSIPGGLIFLKWSNLWTILYVSILILGSLNLLVIQLFSFLTSLFDEFEDLREIKEKVIFGLVTILAVTSMLFCSNHGLFFFEMLSKLSVLTQIILNLLLIFVVLWVYGRERFQRDLHFMTGQIYSTFMVYVVRFVTPIFLSLGVLVGCALIFISLFFQRDAPYSAEILLALTVFLFLISWCLIPGYCIVKIKQTAGSIGVRLKRCVRTTDWYPADPADKQSYEERFSSIDIAHPLTILSEE